ncbi:Nif3-like dinuclear metal center hexameric protein [Clostridium novyi]|uniref:Nif3-like dinuclear metal center hexameric protein n=1 Tax=Clostridium novyi TaxID=1542 RepID=UPI0004D50784|nr:Nif3-like dinuclear metal center hexameric protein [Clostridium novyi]KEI13293.1 hypothetical protein Z958_03510 [Clostridium novyi B str. NCTC 9691]
MSLKVIDIKNVIENFAPVKLKLSYDNVGLMVGELDKDVSSILVALDCTLDVIEEAKRKKCNLIFTHHPLLYKKPSSVTSETLVGKKILELIKGNINLYSAHTNMDSVAGGINDTVMDMLGFEESTTIELSEGRDKNDNKSGLGRVAKLDNPITLKELCEKVKTSLDVSFVRYAGEDDKIIQSVAVINGNGQSYFPMAKEMGVDCIITGDTTYHFVSDYKEEGIGIIDAGHFPTEWLAFKNIVKILEKTLKEHGFDNKLIFSEVSKDPYKLG